MPRIWLDYCQFLMDQCRITRTRHVFDRALRALPITQHHRVWPLYLKFLKMHDIPETAVRVFRRYLKVSRAFSLSSFKLWRKLSSGLWRCTLVEIFRLLEESPMEAVGFSKTLVSFYYTLWCHIAGDSSLRSHCCKNIKCC